MKKLILAMMMVCAVSYGQNGQGDAIYLPLTTGISSNALNNAQTSFLGSAGILTLPREVRSGRIYLSVSGSSSTFTNANTGANIGTNFYVLVATGCLNTNGTSTNFTSWNESTFKVAIQNPNTNAFCQSEGWFEMQGIKWLKPVALVNTSQGTASNILITVGLPRN